MLFDEFLTHFQAQFEDTNPEEITASTVYKDLDEWSSIVGFSTIAMVKLQYNKTLTGAEIRSCNTVEDLFNCIAAK